MLSAIEWINNLPVTIRGIESLKFKLNQIEKQQQGIDINDIEDPYLLNNLAKLHKSSKAYKKAEIIYLKSLELDDKNTYTLNGLGGNCRVAGRHQDGIKYYNMAFQLKKEAASLNGLGAIYRELGELCSAEKYYNDALEIDHKNSFSHNGIGAVLFDQGNYDEGRIHFELAGDNIDYLFLLSNKYQSIGSVEKAIECLNIILTKDQSNVRANNQLSELRRRDA